MDTDNKDKCYADDFLELTLNYAGFAKSEMVNVKHIDLLAKAMELVRQVRKERAGKN